MASSHGNVHSEPAKMEQIITEFFSKSLHIILESRSSYVSSRNFSGEQTVSSPSSSSSSSSSVRPRDKWFNLALRDCPTALENIDLWRQSNLEPMVVDVILVKQPLGWDPVQCSPRTDLVRNAFLKDRFLNHLNSDSDEFGCEVKSEKIIERWVVQYENRKSRDSSSGSKRSGCTSSHILYKKSILLLRSLYLTVRLLPAYKLFRELNSSGQICTFTLAHRVSSFVEPFTRREESEMQRFWFTPLDTSCGRLCLSVLYHSSLSDVSSEPSTPLSPQFIPDYVGSPLADPLKRFPSLPMTGMVSHSSPSFSPFARRHSWSYDLYNASPPSALASPTYSESRALVSNLPSSHLPPMSLPSHPPETLAAHNYYTRFDEYWPSPTFSSSPSPSPPTNIPGSHRPKALYRVESAPVCIPAAKIADTPAFSGKYNLPPSPPLKVTRPKTHMDDKSTGLTQRIAPAEKFSLGRDEMEKLSGLMIPSNNSPQVSFSRSQSKMFPDDFDDLDYACPFLDDDDTTDPGSRPESFDKKGLLHDQLEFGGLYPALTQDAAVGALVRMLQKAPPLRQDSSDSVKSSKLETLSNISNSIPVQDAAASSVVSSGVFMSKTTSDALEELNVYREMKNSLLGQGGT